MPESSLAPEDAAPGRATGASMPAWLPALLAAVAALLLYAVTLGGSYVYDDVLLQEDARYTHPSLWYQFWTRDYSPGTLDKLYRPLTCMTLAVEYTLHGDRPWLYHLVNTLLHAAAAAAVAELGRRLLNARVGLVAGVLFAVHPVHVEAVAGLVGRAEILCTLATVGALLLFLRPMTGRRAAAIAALLIAALLSKEQGVLLPAMLLAIVPFRRKILHIPTTSDNARSERGAMNGLTLAVCFITAGYMFFRETLLGFEWDRSLLEWAANPLVRSAGADRLFMPFVLLGRYLLLLIAPIRLSLDYGAHVIGWTVDWRQPYVYLGMATLAAWSITLALAARRRRWAIVFCLLALALSYGMISNAIILIGTIFGERLMYMPSAFFLILIAALLCRVCRPPSLCIVVGILIALACVRSFTYGRRWNHPLGLYLSNLHENPRSLRLHALAYYEYEKRGNWAAARAIGKDSVRQVPDCYESYVMCVDPDLKLHDFTDAEAAAIEAGRHCPGIRSAMLYGDVEAEKKKNR
ncbi:MAG TPA: glycosyltransferase family 39 protein [Tepidisphaeraceae bacterium]|nr:glycosyltransferase family 39 protein [Tepidisphaeraceae bacterium]